MNTWGLYASKLGLQILAFDNVAKINFIRSRVNSLNQKINFRCITPKNHYRIQISKENSPQIFFDLKLRKFYSKEVIDQKKIDLYIDLNKINLEKYINDSKTSFDKYGKIYPDLITTPLLRNFFIYSFIDQIDFTIEDFDNLNIHLSNSLRIKFEKIKKEAYKKSIKELLHKYFMNKNNVSYGGFLRYSNINFIKKYFTIEDWKIDTIELMVSKAFHLLSN